jgi:hypothetical protein
VEREPASLIREKNEESRQREELNLEIREWEVSATQQARNAKAEAIRERMAALEEHDFKD